MQKKPFIIGITGNIASGKSVVRQYLENLGSITFDADLLAHRTYLKGKPAYQPIIDTFGTGILAHDMQIDRKKLAKIVFKDEFALEKLEAIVHPEVTKMINALVTAAKSRIVVIEAIKLIEAGMAADCHQVWVVSADDTLRLQRLVEDRNMRISEARQRIESQSPQVDKITQAHQVIYTDGKFNDTYNQVNSALNDLKLPESADEEILKLDSNFVIRPLQVWDEVDWNEFQLKLPTGSNDKQDTFEVLAKQSVMGLWQANTLARVAYWKMEALLALITGFAQISQNYQPDLGLAFQTWIERTAWQHLSSLLLVDEKTILQANFNQQHYHKLDMDKDLTDFPPIRALLNKYAITKEQVSYKRNPDFESKSI